MNPLSPIGVTAGRGLAMQSYTGFSRFSAQSAIPIVVVISITRGLGATDLLITDEMVSARMITERIAMRHEGKIVWQGQPAEIDDSGNAFVDGHGCADGPSQMAVRRP